jgi:hypothetical protein
VPVPEPLVGVRVVAEPAAIDRITLPAGSRAVRIAPDDLFIVGAEIVTVDDHHAIVEPERMFVGVWLDTGVVNDWVATHADWHLPHGDRLSQGMVAALPVKILVEGDRALVMAPVSFAAELEERL